jgi:C-terminal peptidase prc
MDKKIERQKRLLKISIGLAIFFFLLSGLLIYLNFDYLAFKFLITQKYIYTDTLDTVYDKYLKTDPNGNYLRNFDDLVIALSTIGITYENKDNYTYLYIPEAYEAYKAYTKDKGLKTEVRIINDDIVYLSLTNFSKYSLDLIKKNMDVLTSRKNIIIDLRDNGGGRVDIMRKTASYFLPKNAVIAQVSYRNRIQITKSRTKQVLSYDNIYILQSGSTASASENLIAALKDNLDNVKLIGENTFGKGIGQLTIPLKDGYAVKATTLLWQSPKGYDIHLKGIAPDIEYGDPDMLEYAIELLNSVLSTENVE